MKRAITIAFLLVLASACSREHYRVVVGPDTPSPITFNGSSQLLKATEIVPTLDAPMPTNKNVIWCASFQSAWKSLEGLAGEPIALAPSNSVADALNAAADPKTFISPENLYAISGWNQKGIVDQIRRDLSQRFPQKAPPDFSGIAQDSFVAYAYLEASVKFPLPYNQNTEPLVFTDAAGNEIKVTSFKLAAIPSEYFEKLRHQPGVLFDYWERDWGTNASPPLHEFAIDLCTNSFPDQIVVARITPGATLASCLTNIEERLKATPGIKPAFEFTVPDLHWFISHHFSGLEGKSFLNQKLNAQRLDIAQQDILFRLDRNGADIRAESKNIFCASDPDMNFDRPFLIYMKKRGASTPYFVMWVNNAELLQPWKDNPATTSAP